ncbi:MAG: hypothetical protein FJZ63_07235 [Chlamydiae bacterium]|nr:hypothetical protein [Chlamydiota bacterium]
MEKLYKHMLHELDELLARAPDVDMEYEYTQFCEVHEAVLWDSKTHIPGLLPRILLVDEIVRFQKTFIIGGDISAILSKILNHAKNLQQEALVKNFSDEKRMQQMAKILESHGLGIFCRGRRRQTA